MTQRAETPTFHGVRYQAGDVARSVDFYTRQLGFKLEHQHLPDFAAVSLGELKILLSGHGASGSRPMPDGQRQEPGGKQIQLEDPDGNPIELFEPAQRSH